jgi:polyhydroxybutyrate depolymerase
MISGPPGIIMRKNSPLIIAMAAILLTLSGQMNAARWRRQKAGNDKPVVITIGGRQRWGLVHVPKSLSADKLAPLVLVFHGGGGHARNMPNFTGFDDLADEQGFLVAYPESFNKNWNDTRGMSGADDVSFVQAFIVELERLYKIDPKRIYATGISNGGFFSTRLACDSADTFAAVASVAATMPETLLPVCKPSRPVSVLFMHGTKDPLVPINGGAIARSRGRAVSLADAAKFWRDFDQTSAKPAAEDLPDQAHDATKVHRDAYGGGKQETEVVVYTIENAGHTWPGGTQYLPSFIVGKVSQNLDATQVIWDFFQKHSLP